MEAVSAPVISLQHDWETSLTTKAKDTVWLTSSVYDSQTKRINTKHGELTFVPNKDSLSTTSTPPFSVSIVNSDLKWIKVHNSETNKDINVFAPTKTIQEPSKKAIRSLGVSPQGGLGIFGSDDGSLHVCDVQDGSIRRNLEGHKGDVTYCGFFPSGQVALSGALDWRLKIWNLASGDCAATLIGHGGSVLGADIVERGRNIMALVSCSRDGTAKLWDVSTQAVIATFATPGDPGYRQAVNDISVFSAEGAGSSSGDAREVGTEGKAIALAGEDGVLRVFDIRSRNEVSTFPSPPTDRPDTRDAYNTCASAHLSGNGNTVVGGTESGHVIAWDLRSTTSPLHALRLTTASIKKLRFSTTGTLWAATGDGTTAGIQWNEKERAQVSVVLSGSDSEPIFGLGVAGLGENNGTLVASGARDGRVRFYFVHGEK